MNVFHVLIPLLGPALLPIIPMVVASDLDVRVPEGTDVALLIDFDAIRRSGANVGKMATDAIDECVRISAFREETGAWMKGFGRILERKREDAGIMAEDFHWMLFGLRAKEHYFRDDQSFTQQVWSAAAAIDGCNWKRIGDVVTESGLEWQKDSVFGHRVFTVFKKQGKIERYHVRCVPGGDTMAYFGHDASREWECYNTSASQDARFAEMGCLADKEVVRIVLSDDKPLSDVVRHFYYRNLYPAGLEHIPDRIQRFMLTLLLDGDDVSAELVFSCANGEDSGTLASAYLAKKTPEGIADMEKRHKRSSSGRENGLSDMVLRMKKHIVETMEVSCEHNAVVVRTGKQDAKTALMIILGWHGSLVDFFETFFR